MNLRIEKILARFTTLRSVQSAWKIDFQVGKWVVLAWMLPYSFESQAQKIRTDLTSDEAIFYLTYKDGPVDNSELVPMEELKNLSLGTEENVSVQSLEIIAIRGAKAIGKQLFTSEPGASITDLTDILPLRDVEMKTGDALSFKVVEAVKVDEKTGESSPYKLKRSVYTITVR